MAEMGRFGVVYVARDGEEIPSWARICSYSAVMSLW